jgi:hypothetical protein
MRIEPELDEVVNGHRGILTGIDLCLRQECLVSGVALIFSGIDSLAALTRPIDATNTSRSVFIEWVEQFLLPESGLACSAIDFYAARCGVLHTHSADSDLQRQGSARPLIYEWQQGPRADAQVSLPPGAIVIEVERLHTAFKVAVDRFFVAADTQAETKKRVHHHLKALLCYRPWPVLAGQVAV